MERCERCGGFTVRELAYSRERAGVLYHHPLLHLRASVRRTRDRFSSLQPTAGITSRKYFAGLPWPRLAGAIPRTIRKGMLAEQIGDKHHDAAGTDQD